MPASIIIIRNEFSYRLTIFVLRHINRPVQSVISKSSANTLKEKEPKEYSREERFHVSYSNRLPNFSPNPVNKDYYCAGAALSVDTVCKREYKDDINEA